MRVRGVEYINLERCQPKHPLRVRVRVTGGVGVVVGMVRVGEVRVMVMIRVVIRLEIGL